MSSSRVSIVNCILGLLTVALVVAAPAPGADIAALVQRLNAVGPEGAGNPDAAAAWAELSRLGPDALPQLLAALDNTSPTAANWLRSAIDAITERERRASRPLPVATLETFLRDTRHSGKARRLAYELLCCADANAPHRLLPAMLNDPGAELRYDAVAAAFAEANKEPMDSAAAKATLLKLLGAAREPTQVEEIARALEQRGEAVDLTATFGFITHWHLAAPFDNTAGKGWQTVYPPEQQVDLGAKSRGKGGTEVAWTPCSTADKNGSIDLNKVIGKLKNAVAYAYAAVESPDDRPVEVRASSSAALKIYVNGTEVFARESYHQSYAHDMHVAPARFRKGRNTILIKVCQNDQTEEWAQNWMFRVRVTDALGTPVPLTVLKPDAAKEPR
jgi:hypothetical protein